MADPISATPNRARPPRSPAAAARGRAQDGIEKVECVAFEDLGMEAIWKIEVRDFPAFIIIDGKGNDFSQELNLG